MGFFKPAKQRYAKIFWPVVLGLGFACLVLLILTVLFGTKNTELKRENAKLVDMPKPRVIETSTMTKACSILSTRTPSLPQPTNTPPSANSTELIKKCYLLLQPLCSQNATDTVPGRPIPPQIPTECADIYKFYCFTAGNNICKGIQNFYNVNCIMTPIKAGSIEINHTICGPKTSTATTTVFGACTSSSYFCGRQYGDGGSYDSEYLCADDDC
jgi:hypothetical protein